MPRRMMLKIGDFARDGDVAQNRIGLQHALDMCVEVADRKGRFGSENWGEKVLHEKGSLATRRALNFGSDWQNNFVLWLHKTFLCSKIH